MKKLSLSELRRRSGVITLDSVDLQKVSGGRMGCWEDHGWICCTGGASTCCSEIESNDPPVCGF